MTHESDPTKHLPCFVSFDPALDREAMGADFVTHFGHVGETVREGRYGSRDPGLIKVLPGRAASTVHLRPLRAYERAACDAMPSAEARWLSAFQYAFVRAELAPDLTGRPGIETHIPITGDGVRLSPEGLDWIAERAGIEALYEIGAVAYSRSRLGPFGRAYAPLPATSALELLRSFPPPAATLPQGSTGTAQGTTIDAA